LEERGGETQNSTPKPLFSFNPILVCCCHPKSKNERHKKKLSGQEQKKQTNKQTISCVSPEQREIVSDLIIHVNIEVLFDRGWI
jgi:hypothetical protein